MQLVISGGLTPQQYGAYFSTGQVSEVIIMAPSNALHAKRLPAGIELARKSGVPMTVHPAASKYID